MTREPDPIVLAIVDLVAERYEVTRAQILGECRMAEFTLPRHVAMALAREVTDLSWQAIGREFDRDHTVVMYACRKVSARAKMDTRFRIDLAVTRSAVESLAGLAHIEAEAIMAGAEQAAIA